MTGRIHPELAGVPQIFARDLRLPIEEPLTFLAIGQAEALRADARSGHLVCPLPRCPDPRLTTRGQSRRDHFAHLRSPNGTHAPETLAHHTAKHLVARWLREALLTSGREQHRIAVDDEAVDGGQRPDVLLDLGGPQVAYEVQYAHLTPVAWAARHHGYRSRGIRDVWLFAGKRYLRNPRTSYARPEERAMVPLFAEVLAAGHPLMFIDPLNEVIGLGTGWPVDELLAQTCSGHRSDEFVVEWTPMAQVPIRAGMPVHPCWPEQRARSQRRRQQHEQDLHAKAEEQLRVERAREELDALWAPVRARLEQEVGELPAIVDDFVASDVRLKVASAAWRWAMVAELAEWRGRRTSRGRLLEVMLSAIDPELRDALWRLTGRERSRLARFNLASIRCNEFLCVLRAAGWIWFGGKGREREDIYVLADVAHPPPPTFSEAIAKKRWRRGNQCWELLHPEGDEVLVSVDVPLFERAARRPVGRITPLRALQMRQALEASRTRGLHWTLDR